MTEYGVRLMVALVAITLCAVSWIGARRRLNGWHRLPLDYTLGLYTLSYAIGCVILYLFQAEYLYRFYGGAVFIPARTSYSLILLVAAMPYLFVPWTVAAFAGGRRARPAAAKARPPLRPEAVIGAITIVLGASFLLIAPVALMLIGNALGDLTSTTSAQALYARRQEVFETVSFLQGGIIYSVLPPIAAIILFWPNERRWITRSLGLALGLFATLLNLGMFQIGPTLAFLLVCIFCYVALRHGRANPLALGAGITVGILVLGLYSLVKATPNQLGQVELFVMRLPIPLPYLIQMAGETAAPGSSANGLSFQLGEYMFPELRQAQAFVATPQPAFVDAWFNFNFVAGIAVLILAGLMIVIFGRLLASSGFGHEKRDGRLILWSVVAAPTLYYMFQVDLFNLFTSAYSITFCILPALAILCLDAFLPRAAVGRPASRQMRR